MGAQILMNFKLLLFSCTREIEIYETLWSKMTMDNEKALQRQLLLAYLKNGNYACTHCSCCCKNLIRADTFKHPYSGKFYPINKDIRVPLPLWYMPLYALVAFIT